MYTSWADYSGAAPILLSVELLSYWRGIYLPTNGADATADLDLPEGRFIVCDDFDFEHPRTDYDRVCALPTVPTVQCLSVGPGMALVFAVQHDLVFWWQEHLMLVSGGDLPDPTALERVDWSAALRWQSHEASYVLMNSTDHPADPHRSQTFEVEFAPGEYIVHWGTYGWAANDPLLNLYRFVLDSASSPT